MRLISDSRRWGLVPRGSLIGPVLATYWPIGRVSHGLWYALLSIAAVTTATLLLMRARTARRDSAG